MTSVGLSTKQGQSILVGLGEVKISGEPDSVLTCLGLGSCVALTAYDVVTRIGGMAHIVLPDSEGLPARRLPKFADIAIEFLLNDLAAAGAPTRRLTLKMSGGAEMSLPREPGTQFKTGERNIQATIDRLAEPGLRLSGWEIGGEKGRSVRLNVATGKVLVAEAGGPAREI